MLSPAPNYSDTEPSTAALAKLHATGCVNGLNLSPDAKSLRLGIVLGSDVPSGAVEEILNAISSCKTLEIGALVRSVPGQHNSESTEPFLFKLWRRWNAHQGKSYFHNDAVTVEDLQTANLDFMIQIGNDAGHSNLETLSQCGICRLPNLFSALTDIEWFWKMYRRDPVFETRVHVRNGKSTKYAFVALDQFSLPRNRMAKLRKICELLERELPQLVRETSVGVRDLCIDSHSKVEPMPSNADVARFFLRSIADGIPRVCRSRLFKEHWFIAFRRNPGNVPISPASMTGFHIVSPPSDRFYADPFLLNRDGRHFLFFEDYPFDHGKGVISFTEIDANGNCSPPEVVLEAAHHFSYPYVFEHDGEIYMVPESLATQTVDLYRAVEFPKKWTLEKTLLQNVSAVDPTILFHDGKFWMFVGGMSKECLNEELHLFYADSLFGPWVPHEKNPVVSDVRRARPAGKIFCHNGELIRPGQDCSPRYGRAVALNRIEELSTSEYRETQIAIIGPEWSKWNRGTHTFNQTETLQVVDGRVSTCRFRFRLSPDKSRLARSSSRVPTRDCPQVITAPCASAE